MSEVTKIGSVEDVDRTIKKAEKEIKERRAEQRKLFPEAPEGTCSARDLELWKNLLARSTNHANRNKALKAIISKTIADREKYFRKMSAALAEAVRDKSTLPLEYAFGSDNWERKLDELEARDKYHDSLRAWMEDNQG